MQVLGLGGVVAIALLWGLFVGVVSPLKRAAKERRERIEQLGGDLRVADTEIRRMTGDRDANSNLVERIKMEDRHVLHSRLGNYLLSATEAIDTCARAAAVDIDAIAEIGTSILPQRQGGEDAVALHLYSVNVKVRTGLHDLLRLLRIAREQNPYIVVSAMELTARPATPAQHDMTITLQWPIWNDSERAPELARFLSVPPAVPADDTLAPPALLPEAAPRVDGLTEGAPADAPPAVDNPAPPEQPAPLPPPMEGGPPP
jgi:hypothetical protein